ncbi:MAG: DUF6065 family protein [Pseudomonadota bacterium]
MTANVVFSRAYGKALDPMPADRAALGMIPISAFQYCEAMRAASSLGWYVFPPKTISLMFDGREVFIADDGQWRTFTHEPLEDSFQESWDSAAPKPLHGHAPSYIRSLSEPGILQIWSGWFVETAPGWSLHVRPLVNIHTVSAFDCFEAIVETDTFRPSALFVNLQITRTNSEILIKRDFPLFQVCAVQRPSLEGQSATFQDITTPNQAAGSEFGWDGLMKTMRIPGVTEKRAATGSYGAEIRRRKKSGSP